MNFSANEIKFIKFWWTKWKKWAVMTITFIGLLMMTLMLIDWNWSLCKMFLQYNAFVDEC